MAEDPILIDNFIHQDDLEVFGDYASKVKFFSVTLDGVVTDFAVSDYVNQLFIVISQFQKIGTLVSVTKGSVKNLNSLDGVFDVKTLFGVDNQECQLAARFLASRINTVKPILFGISLKNYEPKTLKAIGKVLEQNLS